MAILVLVLVLLLLATVRPLREAAANIGASLLHLLLLCIVGAAAVVCAAGEAEVGSGALEGVDARTNNALVAGIAE